MPQAQCASRKNKRRSRYRSPRGTRGRMARPAAHRAQEPEKGNARRRRPKRDGGERPARPAVRTMMTRKNDDGTRQHRRQSIEKPPHAPCASPARTSGGRFRKPPARRAENPVALFIWVLLQQQSEVRQALNPTPEARRRASGLRAGAREMECLE